MVSVDRPSRDTIPLRRKKKKRIKERRGQIKNMEGQTGRGKERAEGAEEVEVRGHEKVSVGGRGGNEKAK
jgi:hypothetical protein